MKRKNAMNENLIENLFTTPLADSDDDEEGWKQFFADFLVKSESKKFYICVIHYDELHHHSSWLKRQMFNIAEIDEKFSFSL